MLTFIFSWIWSLEVWDQAVSWVDFCYCLGRICSSGPGHHLPSSHTVTVWGFLGGAMKAWCIPSCPWHELMFNLCWHGGSWWGRNRLIATYEVVRVGCVLLQGPHQTSFPGELVEGAGWPVGDNLKRHCPFFCQLFFWLRMLGIPFSSSVPWKTCMS